jgi:N-formylmaleamate deformylase
MADVKANGIRIHYERTGGHKPPLVLCHGITDTGGCWPRVTAALKNTYDLILLDARGHGLSEAPKSGYSVDIMADDVASVIEALCLKKPVLMGHSMGAMTVAVTAAHYPALVRGLVLEDPPWSQPPQSAAEWANRLDHLKTEVQAKQSMTSDEMIKRDSAGTPGITTWDKSEFDPWSEAKRLFKTQVTEGLRSDPPAWQETARRIACPTLLITADPARGSIVTAAAAQRAVALNPKIQVVHIAGAGHNVRREAFEKYIEAVTAFLAGLPK